MPLNIEIKARCRYPEKVREALIGLNADFKGTDYQVDTYFNVAEGRLKLREGNIENNLIYYKRPDLEGPKKSDVLLYPAVKGTELKTLLTGALGIKVIVDKKREIYFVDNVKFHIDEVMGLGSFVEIEAIGEQGEEEELERQCKHYMTKLDIAGDQLLTVSYSDMLLS